MPLVIALLVALLPIGFPARPGWHVGAGRAQACPGTRPSRCEAAWSWASTVPRLDCGACLPHRTVAALPADGIAIDASVSIERPPVAKQIVRWPVGVRPSDVVAGFEGLPARIGVYQLFARVGRDEIYLFVFFGRDRPTARQLARANAELAAARLP